VEITDNELLSLAKKFDKSALAEIYDRYSTVLYHYAYRQTGNQQTAEDCVAETFSRFIHALQNKKGPKKHLRAYLYRIAHNWISDLYRKKPAEYRNLDEIEEAVAKYQVSVESKVIAKDAAQVLRDFLSKLTPDQRQVIALKHLEDMSNAEVAEIMGKSIGSVKALNSRGLNNLRSFMKREGNLLG
jgi:RNA polymerase sigma-70 factor (ECF subfamily)